jgi:predicted nucleic acid-binding protein
VPKSAEAAYLDTSALVKLIVPEPETGHLIAYLAERPRRVSSWLTRVELIRVARRHGQDVVLHAQELCARLFMLRPDTTILDAAAQLPPQILRSLDAIHLASALRFGDALGDVVTYDLHMVEAATALGLQTVSPGR